MRRLSVFRREIINEIKCCEIRTEPQKPFHVLQPERKMRDPSRINGRENDNKESGEYPEPSQTPDPISRKSQENRNRARNPIGGDGAYGKGFEIHAFCKQRSLHAAK